MSGVLASILFLAQARPMNESNMAQIALSLSRMKSNSPDPHSEIDQIFQAPNSDIIRDSTREILESPSSSHLGHKAQNTAKY